MEKDLVKFMENVTFINKELAKYEDEKGTVCIIPVGQLICNCSYNEMDKNEFIIAKFNKLIDSSIDYKEITVTRAVSKEEVTKNKDDKYVLTDKELKVKQVWIIQNALKSVKSFANKEDALKLLDEINNKVLKNAELI